MDLTTLNLNEEQMTALEGHILEEVTKAKDSFKEYIPKDEVEKLTQGAGDKVRTEYSKKMKALEDELVKYKPVEKTEKEIEVENRLKALEKREKMAEAKEKLLTVSDKLKEQGLPQQLSKYLVGAEEMETEINSLKEMFNNLVLNNSFIPNGHKSKNESNTFEEFKKMTYDGKLNLMQTNRELYDKYSLMARKEKGWV
ncbi:hypothetical protein Ccar_16190 [Clostridium carboxidivorans P7]|uniref:DUF4355 domain-containing protein n=1 Tax=Clostridium carboxidivorans P7 TaxID=536227 RepID=C6Q139_9CLOT|nr:DUF4355 domain-containing protein [Clostridium carboxidivorans]AKN32318.1 hypothetical protein Ccar_16190 [Clostridium carboxidivorans P7]EET84775.1 conserved hypothetical protein [Clostridium carboxidivorans P7]